MGFGATLCLSFSAKRKIPLEDNLSREVLFFVKVCERIIANFQWLQMGFCNPPSPPIRPLEC